MKDKNSQLKWCPRCEAFLARDLFNKNRTKPDGLQSHCRECRKRINKGWRTKFAKSIAVYENKRWRKEHPIPQPPRLAQEVKGDNKLCSGCKQTLPLADFLSDPRKKSGYASACRKCSYKRNVRSQAKYPEKAEARRLFALAVKRGEIKRRPCEVCGEPKSHGHHEDYSRPLDVMWLCSTHHAKRHAELRRFYGITV